MTQNRLATYGTLQPGEPNYHEVAMLSGTWTPGTIRGHLHQQGWGAAMGFPGIVLDDAGDEVPVQVLTSPDLPDHWARLDAFEGPGYQRVPVQVTTADGVITAQLYVLTADMS